MKTSLSPGAIGLNANQMEAIELAHYYWFQAVEPQTEYISALDADGIARLRDVFEEDLSLLPATATVLSRVGVTRVGRWIAPASDSITYVDNFKLHVKRVRQAAQILVDNGIRLGLEYVGAKTSWTSRTYPFIRTMLERRTWASCSTAGTGTHRANPRRTLLRLAMPKS